MTDLLEAVDALTLPTRTKVVQWFTLPGGKERAVTTPIQHEPLLTQLEDAIRGAMDTAAGANASSASTRSVINSDALFQFMQITNMIRDWCRLAGVEPRAHAAEGLRAWYAATLATTQPRLWEETQLRGWAGTIRAIVNPARTMELTAACPVCASDTWTDVDGTVFRHPVRVEYVEGSMDILRTARALCRSCAKVWRGSNELRELRWDMDTLAAQTEGSAS